MAVAWWWLREAGCVHCPRLSSALRGVLGSTHEVSRQWGVALGRPEAREGGLRIRPGTGSAVERNVDTECKSWGWVWGRRGMERGQGGLPGSPGGMRVSFPRALGTAAWGWGFIWFQTCGEETHPLTFTLWPPVASQAPPPCSHLFYSSPWAVSCLSILAFCRDQFLPLMHHLHSWLLLGVMSKVPK